MMDFEEFKNKIADTVKDYMPDKYQSAEVSISDVKKNNDVSITGITIMQENNNTAPCVYLDDYYEAYEQGASFDDIVNEIADIYVSNDNRQYSIDNIIYFFVSMILVLSICMGVLFQGMNNNVVYAAGKVTEEQLYMLLPKYLVEDICDPYYDKCRGYCEDAIGTVSKADELISSYLYCFKSGSKVLVKEAGSMVGITSSNFDSMNKQVAGELLKSYFSVKDSWISDATEICDDYKYVTKTYGILSSGLKDEFKAINKTRKYIVYTDEQIDDIFKNTEITGKILGKIGDAQDAADVLITILELNQLELESIDRLIISTRVDTDLQKGLIEIRNDMTDDLTGYLIRNYLNDKALDKLAKVLTKATAGHISGTATLVAGLIADLTYTSYTKYNPSVDDIVYTALLEGYYDVINGAQDKIMSKFGQGTATVDDIETYKVIYNFRVSTLKFWMQRCEKLAKKSDSRLSNRLNIYGESLVTDFNYDLYLKSCLTKANKDYDAGLITISNENVTKYTPNGNVIDETYDSKESILAKFTVIQTKYKPNVGQTWTGSYNGCIQCCGFAQLVFNNLFGYNLSGYYGDRRYMIRDEEKAIKVGQLIGSNVTTDNVKAMFSKAQLGDFVQMDGATYGQHSAIFVSADDTGVTLYDCNSKPHGETTNCLINQWKITWANWIKWYGTAPSGRQNGISVYHATNYAEIYGDGSDLFYDDTVNFVIQDGVLVKYNGWQAHVVIPEEVTEIGDGAFKNNTTMISIEIPESVIKIGNEAFYGCTSLVAVYIPDSVKEIGSSAFCNDNSLSSVHLPENDNYISVNSSMFCNCSNLLSVQFPNNVTEISDNAFSNCQNLSEIELPSGLVALGENAFYDCDSIEEIRIPKSLETSSYDTFSYSLGGAFMNCSGLKKVNFEEGITSIPAGLFYYCDGIESIEIPNTVTKIGENAFGRCENLEKVIIPTSVTEIGNIAFGNCSKLSDVDLPEKLVVLGENAFYDCDGIEEISIPKSLEISKYDTFSYSLGGAFMNCSRLKKVNFEEGITSIPAGLFYYCDGIESIEIPNTVTKIGENAFGRCENLEKVIIPTSVTEIGNIAFGNCSKLSDVDLPEKLVVLGENAFYDCDEIEEISIPKSLEISRYDTFSYSIGGAFMNCSGLKKVNFEEGITRIPAGLFFYCDGIEEISIPNTVSVIPEYLFYNATGLSTINIPNSVNMINENAFAGCGNLKEAIIPDTVNSMGTNIFANCTSLEKAHIPDIRVNLPDSTFSGCTSLTEVNFPDTLETIGQSAFYNCTSLKEVNLPEKVNTINSSAFNGCTSLEKVTIPSSVKTINSSAFSHCEALTDLTISEGVTTIYSNAFEYNKALAKVTLPDSLQTLGEYAFRYCDVLNEVHLGAGIKTVPKYCFYEDPELVSVVLPQQVTKVDEFAFGNCTKFTDITMNRNVSSASLNAFSYPAKLTIHGVPETYAETFANDNSIKFDALSAKTTAIKLNKTELELGRGYTERLTAAITPEDSADEFTWTSTDEDIVTVDADGKIKAISGGEASVIAMSGDIMEICEVTVYEPVSSVYLDKSSYTGTTGDTLQLTATIYPSDATYKDIIWSSDNNNVASVDSNGLVTLGKYGTANVTVTTKDMSRTATCTITVKGIDVTGVSLSEKKTTIQVGQQKTLEAIIAPENATNKNVTWTSTKTAVATVNNGVVTGVSTGTAIIMVKTEDGAKTASCTVTVEEAADVVSQNADVVFDSEVDDDGTKTVDPVSFNIYNNTGEAITGVEATLDKGEAFSVELPDTIAANDSIVITIIPNEDLSVGVYEDVVTVVAGENTLNIPIKLEIKAKNNSSGENKSDDGDKENEQGEDKEKEGDNDQGGNNPSEGNGGTSQEIKDKTDNGTGNNSATDTQQTPAGTNNQPTSQPGNTPAQTTIPSVTPTPAVSDQPAQPTTGIKVSKPSKVTLSLAKNSAKKTIKVSWKKITAAGFEVQMALNNKFTKSKKTYSTTKTSLSVKKLKKGKTYYVRVRAFNKDGSKKLYGSWSKTKKVKIKK